MSARDYFLSLDVKDQAKLQATFNKLAEFGHIPTRERFKKLETRGGRALFEFKTFQLRFIGAFSDRIFILAHGIRKKKSNHKKSDLDRAVRILNEHATHIEQSEVKDAFQSRADF